ncbi:MAG: winged helix-turn-helix transcriptional regulator [Clostridium sp.]|nr:winged helix-turn-helix transcriptional regulator [Clostridium sp.]
MARFLHEYDYVQEFGEGVDRIFNEMASAGLPAPEYRNNAFMLNATIRNDVTNEINGAINISAAEQAVLAEIKKKPKITRVELQKKTSLGKGTIDRAIKALKENSLIERVGSNKTGHWKIINKGL